MSEIERIYEEVNPGWEKRYYPVSPTEYIKKVTIPELEDGTRPVLTNVQSVEDLDGQDVTFS
jgi:hypothetical protein